MHVSGSEHAFEEHLMRQALALARRGEGCVEPNPMVGAVITSASGDIIGEGWHEAFGGPHAEVAALSAAGIVFGVALVCWLRGWMGGGDVKLLGACALLVPPVAVSPLTPGSVWVISSTTELGNSTSRGLPFQATTLTSMPSLRYLRLSPICLAVRRVSSKVPISMKT